MGVSTIDKTYKTSEVAKLIGIHANTVRMYEDLGLISKPRRKDNGYRVFTDLHIYQFKLARKAFEVEMESKKNELKEMGLPEEEIEMLIEDPSIYENFYVPERARWSSLKNLTLNIGPELDKAFKAIEDEPKNSELIGVLTTANYNDKERVPDKKLSQLLNLFSSISLSNDNLETKDVLGNAYEYLIKQFADEGGTKGGEFYTPEGVVKTLVGIVKPKEGEKIYDPTCGSGGMLINSTYYIEKHNGNPKNVILNGQEINLSTWAICKMNMLFHEQVHL